MTPIFILLIFLKVLFAICATAFFVAVLYYFDFEGDDK